MNLNTFSPVAGLVCLVLSMTSAWAQPVDIGSRLELFVDEHLIAKRHNVELVLHTPVKAPRPKSPLPVRHMVTVIKDGDKYRAWFRGSDPAHTPEKPHSGHPGETVEYAESTDGHEWTFPKLGLHEVRGTTANNVVLAQWPPYLTNFMPFLDTREGVDPSERYKTLAGYPGPGDKRELTAEERAGRGLYAFVSPDGITWTKKEEAIPYQAGWRHAFDSPNVCFWSEAEQLYVCYFRVWTRPGRLRSVARATSPDFVTWSEPVELDVNRENEHLYTTMTHPYVRAPHIYIALPTRFVPGRGDAPAYDRKDVNSTDILFMTWRAGQTQYDRLFAEAFIRPGLDPARWGNRANYVANGVMQTSPEELSIYHRSGDRYTLRTDGFVSARAGAEPGELHTKPVIFNGGELVLNYSTSAVGGIKVEIQDAGGRPIPGFTLDDCEEVIGDRIERAVTWTSDAKLSDLAGKPVRLRFVMLDCDLYSYRFR